jgi:hypothetical protein
VHQWFGHRGHRSGLLDVTRFSYYHRWISNIKLSYVFGVARPQEIKYPVEWITDYNEAKAFAANPENRRRIIRTRYYRVRVMSSVSWEHPNWLKDRSTYHARDRIHPLESPPAADWIMERRGWYDMQRYMDRAVRTGRGEVNQLGAGMWQWVRKFEIPRYDRRIGLNPRLSAEDGEYIPWQGYAASWYIFGGLEIGEVATVANPFVWPEDTDSSELPAPLLVDTSYGDYDPIDQDPDKGVRRSHFSLLGFASEPAGTKYMSGQFPTGNPAEMLTATAQAQIFNNKSWDLWTQDWRTSLAPVSRWDEWISRFADEAGNVSSLGLDLEREDVQDVLDYSQGLDSDFVERFLSH